MTYQFEFGRRARDKSKERRVLLEAEKDFLKGLGNHMDQIAKRSSFTLLAGRRLILLEKYLKTLPSVAQWSDKEKQVLLETVSKMIQEEKGKIRK